MQEDFEWLLASNKNVDLKGRTVHLYASSAAGPQGQPLEEINVEVGDSPGGASEVRGGVGVTLSSDAHITNGTLKCFGDVTTALLVNSGARVVLDQVMVEGGGVAVEGRGSSLQVLMGSGCGIEGVEGVPGLFCGGGASARVDGSTGGDLVKCAVGVLVKGEGSKVHVTSGSISRCRYGVMAKDGGTAIVEGGSIKQCKDAGLVSCGGSITATEVSVWAVGMGAMAWGFGDVTLAGVWISKALEAGVAARKKGSLVVSGGRVADSVLNAAVATAGGKVNIKDVEVVGSGGTSLLVYGNGSELVADGGSVRESKLSGVEVYQGGTLELMGTKISDCGHSGVEAEDVNTQARMLDVEIARCRDHGVTATQCARVRIITSHISECTRAGVCATARGTLCTMDGGTIRDVAEHYGAVAKAGAKMKLNEVDISNCKSDGIRGHGQGTSVSATKCVVRQVGGHGVQCEEGAVLRVTGIKVRGAGLSGVHATGSGSRALVRQGSWRGVKGDSVAADRGGRVNQQGGLLACVTCAGS